MSGDFIESLARLAVDVGANVQEGQIVAVTYAPGMEPAAHAIARRAYERGAKFVDPLVVDGELKRLRLQHAGEETLSFVPSWYGERMLALGEERAARISIAPPIDPGLLSGIDPARAGKDLLPFLPEIGKILGDRSTNWTIVPLATPGWASAIGLDVESLTEKLSWILRFDEDDPAAAWRSRMDELDAVAGRLNERPFDALRFEGPGTDLKVGLLPGSRFLSARTETADGIQHVANIPSEEVFTTPDPERTEGTVTATKPLDVSGTTVEGIRVRFEGGRAVEVDADKGADALRGRAAEDDGAARLGEVALVDREGRIAQTGMVFDNTLLDENAASHIALGNGYVMALEDDGSRERMNQSRIHIDFMIGSDDVAVFGVAEDGTETPVLRSGQWVL
jgi:aminopeptidase